MPHEFYGLTPYEFKALQSAWVDRDRRKFRQEAQWVALLANASGNLKEPLRADELIREREGTARIDVDEIRQRAEQRRRERIQERKKRVDTPRTR